MAQNWQWRLFQATYTQIFVIANMKGIFCKMKVIWASFQEALRTLTTAHNSSTSLQTLVSRELL